MIGLSLPSLLEATSRAAAPFASVTAKPATADACVILFLNGGPSHLDMWDLKPNAPDAIRGEFKPIASSLPGIPVSEHLPRLAQHLHRCTLVRSMHHSVNNAHAAAVYAALTGHDRGENGGGARPTDNPAIGSVVGLQRPPKTATVPYVSLPYVTKEGAGGPPQPGFFGGWLGRNSDPLFVLRDPNAPDFAIPEFTLPDEMNDQRLGSRRRLLGDFSPADSPGDSGRRDWNAFQQKAFELMTSAETRRAFRIDDEPAKTRESYGRNIYGQSTLLARRLIEAGTRVACISWAPDANATWDTHTGNFSKLKQSLLPELDAAVTSLLTDLADRGMLSRTLVAVMGDFGRTPKVNPSAGRDHWNYCYSLLLAGGGIREGLVYGSSDRIGGTPATDPLTPGDIVATIYECLGVPHDLELRDQLGRPLRITPAGAPVADLLS